MDWPPGPGERIRVAQHRVGLPDVGLHQQEVRRRMSRRPGRGRPTAWLISIAWLLALLAGCRADIGASAPVPAAPTLAPTVALPPLPPVTATFPPAVSVPTALPNRATATSPTSAVGPTTSPPAATSSADRLTLSPRPSPPTINSRSRNTPSHTAPIPMMSRPRPTERYGTPPRRRANWAGWTRKRVRRALSNWALARPRTG